MAVATRKKTPEQLKAPPNWATVWPEKGRVRVGAILLKAGAPATLKVKGARWLRFAACTLHVRAQLLERNMAQPQWGTKSSRKDDTVTFLLPGPTKLERFGVWYRPDGAPDRVATFRWDGRGEAHERTFDGYPSENDLWGTDRYWGYREDRVVMTDRVEVDLPHPEARVVLSSSSLPSRIGIGVGDDTPVQVLPVQMEPGTAELEPGATIVGLPETCATRDLAGVLNAAWQRAAGQAPEEDVVEVAIRLTSATDGVVSLELTGAWDRYSPGDRGTLALQGLAAGEIAVPWPFVLPGGAQLDLAVEGRFTGGPRLGLAGPGKPEFVVRASEQVEVAQAVLLSAELLSRELGAVWLRLPRVPAAATRLQVRLTEVAGVVPEPGDRPFAVLDVTLPADNAAYRTAEEGGVWFRAVWPKPVALDGAQMKRPLFVVAAAGSGEGVPLCHAYAGEARETSVRLPPGPVSAGCALVRNLNRNGVWEPQPFHCTPNRWLVDLELVPLAGEPLAAVTVGNQPAALAPGADGRFAGTLTWLFGAKPAGDGFPVRVTTSADLELTLVPALTQTV